MSSQDTLIAIRKAQPGDEAEIANVHTHGWMQAYKGLLPDTTLSHLPLRFKRRLHWWRSIVSGKGPITAFVAEHKEYGVVGLCALEAARDKEFTGQGEITAIYSLEQFHGQGVGKRLMLAAFDELRKQGFRNAYCWVLEGNSAAEFYRKIGGQLRPDRKSLEFDGQSFFEKCFGWEL